MRSMMLGLDSLMFKLTLSLQGLKSSPVDGEDGGKSSLHTLDPSLFFVLENFWYLF